MNEAKRFKTVEKNGSKPQREFLDPQSSDRGGVGGLLESTMRKFKNLVHLILMVPLYALGCAMAGVAAAPGVMLFRWLTSLAAEWSAWSQAFMTGFAAAAAFFTFGSALLAVLPLVNFIGRASLKPWRGPYYSLEAVRWYIHNGLTYAARYTFLEFVTPTPLNILFYRWMGMKIGSGTAINTTWISDPSLITLGDKVTIGGSVSLLGHYGQGGYLVLAPVVVGNGATLGLKCTVMGGVTIGENAKVMPHSVVLPKTVIPAGETWGGIPAVKIEK